MAALTTLTLQQKLDLAHALGAAAKLVNNELQHSPTNAQDVSTAVLAAAKVQLDLAQG